MASKRIHETQLTLKAATRKINEIAANPASRIIVTDHAYIRQTQRIISYEQTVRALEEGIVIECRCNVRSGRNTYCYSVSYTDAIGPIKVVTRIKTDMLLVVITVVDAS